MPSLDTCVNDLFEPGFHPADPGNYPTTPVITSTSSATFSGVGLFRASASVVKSATVLLAGAGSLRAGTIMRVQASAQLDGTGSLSIDAVINP